jgi:hypothetical protein
MVRDHAGDARRGPVAVTTCSPNTNNVTLSKSISRNNLGKIGRQMNRDLLPRPHRLGARESDFLEVVGPQARRRTSTSPAPATVLRAIRDSSPSKPVGRNAFVLRMGMTLAGLDQPPRTTGRRESVRSVRPGSSTSRLRLRERALNMIGNPLGSAELVAADMVSGAADSSSCVTRATRTRGQGEVFPLVVLRALAGLDPLPLLATARPSSWPVPRPTFSN